MKRDVKAWPAFPAALGSLLLLGGVSGCAGNGGNQGMVFSTKTDSLPAADPPALHINEPAIDIPLNEPRTPGWDRQLRSSAQGVLQSASESANAMLRANAIEAMEWSPETQEMAVRRALADSNRGVRFVAAMTVGQQRLKSLADLVEPLMVDESGSVRAAAIYALRRCGRQVDPSPLAAMLEGPSHEERGNAVLVLGELGNRSAIRMLREAASRNQSRPSPARGRIIDMQIAEALVKLGDDGEIEVIRAGLFSPEGFGEIRALAATMLGELGDEAYLATLHDIAVRDGNRREPAEVRMAAAMAVAQLGHGSRLAGVPLEYTTNDAAELRAQAAYVLGAMGDTTHLGILRRLMTDENPMVQVAAAGAIVRITA